MFVSHKYLLSCMQHSTVRADLYLDTDVGTPSKPSPCSQLGFPHMRTAKALAMSTYRLGVETEMGIIFDLLPSSSV